MKNFYLTIGLLLISYLGSAQIVNIPDPIFKASLLNHSPVIDINNDGEIQVSEALNTTTMEVIGSFGTVTNTTGLNAFTNLTSLRINFAYTNTIDVSNLINLQHLNLHENNLTSLSVSGLTNLQTLVCSSNSLTSIDVSGLTNLVLLDFSINPLLDNFIYSELPNLNQLICNNTSMGNTNINVMNNLTYLDISGCQFSNLDVSNLTNLTHLDCSYNSVLSSGISNLNLGQLTNLTYLDCANNTIASLSLENLTNLTYLNCSNNQLSNLDVTNLVHLSVLYCFANQLSSLNLNNQTELTFLNCSFNQLTALNLVPLVNLMQLLCHSNQLSALDTSTLINLEYFNCNNNQQLNTLDVSNLVNLKSLNCSNNNMSTLDLTNLVQLSVLDCKQNQISSLDLSNNVNLELIYVGSNLLTSLDLSQLTILNTASTGYLLNVSDNPNLEYLNLKNGILYSPNLYSTNCPSLTYICADEENLFYIHGALVGGSNSGGTSTTIVENVQINSYCSFVPGGINNSIMGQFTVDINNNGCDVTDYKPKNIKVKIENGTNSGSTFTNTTGNYFFYNQTGNFTLTPQFENPYFTVSPASATLNFPNLDGSSQTQNFCITPNGIHNDVDVTILPITPARPGFDATYQLVYKNKGNQMLSGTVTFNFDDAVLDFISATTAVDAQFTNTLSWNYTNLLPFESRSINLTLNVNSPMETPPVTIDDVLSFGATINPISGDETAEDNIFNLNEIVVGSYDPNDKTCLEGDTIPPTKVGDYLHYLIRFQNSGTAPAENVVIKDIIDTSKFDLASLQLTSTSHPQVTRIAGNKVEFVFQNIQLPAEQYDEPGSHGFVAFKIRTKNNLVVGNTVSNTANIYFDYNFPIVTNTATTTIAVLSASEFENTSVSIAPNPVKNNLTVSANDIISSIQIYDVQGRLIATQVNNSTSTTLDMRQQNVGVYFVKVITENGVKVEKIIKN